MATLPVRVLPDQVLRQKAKRVSIIDGSIQKLIASMFETMHSVGGVGLAAPQIGIPLRVIVIHPHDFGRHGRCEALVAAHVDNVPDHARVTVLVGLGEMLRAGIRVAGLDAR